MPNVDPLEVNQPIANLIVLSNNSGLGGGSVEDGNGDTSFHSIEGVDDSPEGHERKNRDNWP